MKTRCKRPSPEALSFVRAMEMPLSAEESPRRGFAWDGLTLAVRGLGDSEFLHELAHWKICAPERLSIPDYGLGPGPESQAKIRPVLRTRRCDSEESRASVLGVIYLLMLGIDPYQTLCWHGWTWGDDDKLRAGNRGQFEWNIRWLDQNGFFAFPGFDREKLNEFLARVRRKNDVETAHREG